MPTTTPSVAQLQRALALAEQIQKLEDELAGILGGVIGNAHPAATISASTPVATTGKRGGRRKFSAESRAKMAAAQKARWEKKKGTGAVAATVGKKKRVLSPEGWARIVAALKARHAAKKVAAK